MTLFNNVHASSSWLRPIGFLVHAARLRLSLVTKTHKYVHDN